MLPAKTPPPPPKRLAPARVRLVRPDEVGNTSQPPEKQEPSSAAPHDGSLVRPILTAQIEPFSSIARDLPPLFERHYQAISDKVFPLDPDWDRYFVLSGTGTLQVMTARDGPSLVGYIFNLIGPHLHYRSTLCAELEMFWLDEPYRGTDFTLRWFRANEDHLKSLGARRISAAVKNGYKDGRVGLIFKRLGYHPIEQAWSKVI